MTTAMVIVDAMTNSSAATSAIPYVLVDVLSSDVILFGSPLDARFVSTLSGEVLVRLGYGSAESAARCSASIQLTTDKLDCLVALVGDDKLLNVYRVSATQQNGGTTLTKVWSHCIPKRAVKMVWEPESANEKRLVVGDRHGDVRSFIVPIDATPQSSQGVASTANKKVHLSEGVEGSRSVQSEAGIDDDEDEGQGVTLHVGHVSYLTDFTFSSFTSSSQQQPASYIITADRDEHIRISRWGQRRAGYIVLRYLLGSAEAIGAICTVEGAALRRIQATPELGEQAEHLSKYAMLVSADGSRLRIWSLHPDSQRGSRNDLQATFDVRQIAQRYCVIDSRKERKRDRMHGKGKAPVKRNEDGTLMINNEVEHVAAFTSIITKLVVIDDGQQVTLLFALDGARALFTVPIVSLLRCSNDEDLAKVVTITELKLPIVTMATVHRGGETDIWLTQDVRIEFAREEKDAKPVGLLRWSKDERTLVEVSASENVVLDRQHETLSVEGDADMASSLILYDALTLFTKQEFEKTEILEAISAGGLIKGGLANYEIPGRPASRANKQNSEWATRKRERAREVMKQRIEARLNVNGIAQSNAAASANEQAE